MNPRRITTLVFLVSLAATIASAQTPSRLSELQYFAGNWDCTGTAFAMAGNPEHATKGKAHGEWTLGNQWLALSYDEQRTPRNPHPVMARLFLGYDPELKKLVSGALDNMGGYSTSVAGGWSGSTLTFEGPMHTGGMTAKSRETFVKKSATQLTHSSSLEVNGKWQQLDEETCWKK